MCKTYVEERYIICNHVVMWEIPSPDPACNGILHRLKQDVTKKCKHCWVKDGGKKKYWKWYSLANEAPAWDRNWFQVRNVQQIVYPIQEVGLTKPENTNCKTWHRSFPWQTRMWGVRLLLLERLSRAKELELWAARGAPFDDTGSPAFEDLVLIDEDAQEGVPFKAIPIEDLKEEDRVCGICRDPFVSDDPEEYLCSGGGEVARQVPCRNYPTPEREWRRRGNGSEIRAKRRAERDYLNIVKQGFWVPCPAGHVFGRDCLIEWWKSQLAQRQEGQITSCPTCRVAWPIVSLSATDWKKRLDQMAQEYFTKYSDGQRPLGPDYPVRDPEAISPEFYAVIYFSMVAGLPMFATVNHSMNIWGSKNGKLPWVQLAAVLFAGTILQIIWLAGIPFYPLMSFLWVARVIRREEGNREEGNQAADPV